MRRVAISIIMLIATSLLIFITLRWLPGDPIITRLGATPGVDQEQIDQLRADAGLNEPLWRQYWTWVSGMVRGDLGNSYYNQFSVNELISQRVPATLELTALSIIASLIIAIPTAIVASLREGGVVDRFLTGVAAAGMAIPQFLVAVALVMLFAVRLDWLPARGYTPFTESPVDNLTEMVLPVLTLAISAAPLVMRFVRESLIEALGSQYIRTAEGKGASRPRVVIRHALRNALIPGMTVLGLIVGYTLGGAVIIEFVFGIPGLGTMAIDAVQKRDYAVLQSVVLLVSAMFILTTMIVDFSYGWLDPRLRRDRSK